MLFIPLLLLGIILYIIGHRVSSVLIFLFFLFGGFQVVPEFLFETYIGISKGIDFAFVYTIVLFFFGIFHFDDFIPINPLSKAILGYILLLLICIGVSIGYYSIPLSEILRTTRSFFIILSYFLIRRLDPTQFKKIVYALFYITAFQCILFILQSVSGTPILTAASQGGSVGIFSRFYNYPHLLYFLFFLSIFSPLLTKQQKWWIIPLLSFAIILSFSRSAIVVIIMLVLLGYLLQLKDKKRFLRLIPVFLLILPLIGAVVFKQMQGRTLTDLQSVMAGEFMEVVDSDKSVDEEIEDGSTMIFRLALFFERYVDIIDSKLSIVIGKGLSVEGSPYTMAHFNYRIGLTVGDSQKLYDGYIAQLNSPDISWSNLILRYGIVGTVIYMVGFFYFSIPIFRKKTIYSIPFLLYFSFMLMNSFSSDILFMIVNFAPFLLFFDASYYKKDIETPIYSKSPSPNHL